MIYVITVLLIIAIYVLCSLLKENRTTKDRVFLSAAFLLIYLVCVLRATSVGRDIPGYERVYYLIAEDSFSDFRFLYYELGYTFLVKICALLGFSFQAFMAVCYAIALIPIAVFIDKFSKDKLISVVTFLCYVYLDFYLSGLRQAIAISIIMLAITFLLGKSKLKVFWFYVFNVIAILFHKSALVCLAIPFIKLSKNEYAFTAFVAVLFAGLFLLRSNILVFIKDLFQKDSLDTSAETYFGTNAIILLAIAVVMLLLKFIKPDKSIKNEGLSAGALKQAVADTDTFFLQLFIASIALAVFFGMETTARSYLYYNVAIFVVMPNLLNYFEKRSRILIESLLIVFLLLFFINTLNGSNFDIVPYKFFWST